MRYARWSRRAAGRLVDTVLGALALLPGYALVLLGDTTTTTTVDRDHFSSMRMNPDGTTTPVPLRVTTTDYDATTVAGFVLVVLGALLPCYLGGLWPLWDPRCQTFADKVMETVVVVQPRGAPAQV